jgi:hypothetical protein
VFFFTSLLALEFDIPTADFFLGKRFYKSRVSWHLSGTASVSNSSLYESISILIEQSTFCCLDTLLYLRSSSGPLLPRVGSWSIWIISFFFLDFSSGSLDGEAKVRMSLKMFGTLLNSIP